jgi:hypothetical protein
LSTFYDTIKIGSFIKPLLMIKKIVFAYILFLSLHGQAQVKETVTIKAGEDLSTVLSTHGLYKFPDFIYGTVMFRDGTDTKAKMNFNVFLNDMVFIDNKNDTMAIGNPELIDSIKLDSNIFYYQKGYFFVVKDYGDTKLVMQEKINFENVKVGAYGLPSRAGSIDTYGGAGTSFNSITHLILNEDVIIKKETLYLLTYKKYRSAKANLSGFFTAFPDIKKELQTFAESNDINFKKEEDLKKLFQYCSTHS